MAGHYLAYLCCTKCRYSTCCSKAMSSHVQLFHTKGKTAEKLLTTVCTDHVIPDKPEYDLGKSSILQEVMFCVCGFSAHSGNKLAKHLGTNGCQSVYPSLEEAERARNIPEGEEDNFFIYSRNTEGQQKHQEQEGSKEEDKQAQGESGDKPGEEDKMDTEEKDKEETEVSEGEEEEGANVGENEEDKPPGPGGLLFGTLFKYMEDKTEGEAGAEETTETGDKPTPVQDVETVEKDTTTE